MDKLDKVPVHVRKVNIEGNSTSALSYLKQELTPLERATSVDKLNEALHQSITVR